MRSAAAVVVNYSIRGQISMLMPPLKLSMNRNSKELVQPFVSTPHVAGALGGETRKVKQRSNL